MTENLEDVPYTSRFFWIKYRMIQHKAAKSLPKSALSPKNFNSPAMYPSVKKIFALVLMAACSLSACKNDPKAAAQGEASTPLPSAVPEQYLYQISVNKLNLREAPKKDASVVLQFAAGDFVEGKGEVSENEEEVTLRNIPYKEPFYKVTTLQQPAHTGWAFSAALTPVYAGSMTTSPDMNKLLPFSKYLTSLNVKQLDSGKKAWEYVTQYLSNAQGTLSDATFILLERFLFQMEVEGDYYKFTEEIAWKEGDYMAIHDEKFDLNTYPETRQIAENGFRLEVGEGMIFPIVDWKRFGDFFATKVTPPMKQYIEQVVFEQKNLMWDDGGLIIPLEQVADRGHWWERFNKSNPYFVRKDETLGFQKELEFILICGADNTPVFDYETKLVSKDYQQAWAYVAEKYAGTEMGKSVKTYADLVAAEGGKMTPKVEDWLKKYMEF